MFAQVYLIIRARHVCQLVFTNFCSPCELRVFNNKDTMILMPFDLESTRNEKVVFNTKGHWHSLSRTLMLCWTKVQHIINCQPDEERIVSHNPLRLELYYQNREVMSSVSQGIDGMPFTQMTVKNANYELLFIPSHMTLPLCCFSGPVPSLHARPRSDPSSPQIPASNQRMNQILFWLECSHT